MIQGGYELFGHQIRIDYRPFDIDFGTRLLFGMLHLYPTIPNERFLQSNDTVRMSNYLETLYLQFEDQNDFKQIHRLYISDTPYHALAEQLDDLHTTLDLKVEKDGKRKYDCAWFVQLLKQRAHVAFFQYYIAMYLTNISHLKTIE